jgi:hypothetical protein
MQNMQGLMHNYTFINQGYCGFNTNMHLKHQIIFMLNKKEVARV